MQGFFGGVDSVSGGLARRQAHLAIANSLQGAASGRKAAIRLCKSRFLCREEGGARVLPGELAFFARSVRAARTLTDAIFSSLLSPAPRAAT